MLELVPLALAVLLSMTCAAAQMIPRCGRYTPESPEYDLLRKPYNSGIPDEYSMPAVIYLVCDEAGVLTALTEAYQMSASIAVRAGGHNIEGYSSFAPKSSPQKRILIDTYHLDDIRAKPDGKVTVGAGVKVAQLNMFLAAKKPPALVPMTICSTVGVIGSALGGGYGVASRKFGLTADNIVSLRIALLRGATPEIVDVDGASAEFADLFWALRGGGGGNFGVVTEMTLQSHVIPPNAVLFHGDVESSKARELAEFVLTAPDDLFFVMEVHTGDKPIQVDDGLYFGNDPVILEKLKAFVGESNMQSLAPTQASEWQNVMAGCSSNFDCSDQAKAVPYIVKRASKRKALFVESIDDAVQLVELMKNETTDVDFIDIGPFTGKISAVSPTDTALVHRKALFLVMMFKFWDPKDVADPTLLNIGMKSFHDRVRKIVPKATGYPNFVDQDHLSEDWMTIFYGENADRLKQVKTKYDPCNRFNFPMSLPLAPPVTPFDPSICGPPPTPTTTLPQPETTPTAAGSPTPDDMRDTTAPAGFTADNTTQGSPVEMSTAATTTEGNDTSKDPTAQTDDTPTDTKLTKGTSLPRISLALSMAIATLMLLLV